MSVVDVPQPSPGRLGFARHEDVDLFVTKLEAFERGELSPDDWRSFRLLNGVYGQRQDGVNMIRAKLPAGIVTPAQLEALAVIAEKFGGGKGHVTTRQNVQYHFVPSADVEEALRILADAGITTKEACGHSVRNWTCCPFAGVAKDEPFDPTPYVEALARHLLRGPYSSTLPRKLKPSLGGCCGTDCSQAFINDLGFLARKRGDERGFQLLAGGGLSTLRRSGDRRSTTSCPPPSCSSRRRGRRSACSTTIGNRHNRAKARLKWAIDKLGVPIVPRASCTSKERATIRGRGRPCRYVRRSRSRRTADQAPAPAAGLATPRPTYAGVGRGQRCARTAPGRLRDRPRSALIARRSSPAAQLRAPDPRSSTPTPTASSAPPTSRDLVLALRSPTPGCPLLHRRARRRSASRSPAPNTPRRRHQRAPAPPAASSR
jgi:hypothetical protein